MSKSKFKSKGIALVFSDVFRFYNDKNILRIGHSRHEAKKLGEDVKYIYSYETYHKYGDINHEFVKHCLEAGVKRVRDLTYEVIDGYFEKLAKLGVGMKTINQHRSAVKKFLLYIDERAGTNFVGYISKQNYKYEGMPSAKVIQLSNPDKYFNVMEQRGRKLFYHAAKTQELAMLRISELNRIEFDDKNYAVNVYNSKGGKDRVIRFDITDEMKARYEEMKEHYKEFKKLLGSQNWDRPMQDRYRKELYYTCRAAGEYYDGSHMLRATGAGEVYKHLIEKFPEPLTKEQLREVGVREIDIRKYKEIYYADVYLTRALGHNRIGMSRYYAKS